MSNLLHVIPQNSQITTIFGIGLTLSLLILYFIILNNKLTGWSIYQEDIF